MTSVSYYLSKLTEVSCDLIGCNNIGLVLQDLRRTLVLLGYIELPQEAAANLISLRLALGLPVPNLNVPVPSPWRVERLPRERQLQIARKLIYFVESLGKIMGRCEANLPFTPFATERFGYQLSYTHLSWEGFGESEEYFAFLKDAFPQYPDEVIRQWFQRHGASAFHNFDNSLSYKDLKFEKQTWTLDRILSARCCDPSWHEIEDSSGVTRLEALANDEHWLAIKMLELATWPIPPIILVDGVLAPGAFGAEAGLPYLLEGHTRFNYLNCLVHLDKAIGHHDVWVATI